MIRKSNKVRQPGTEGRVARRLAQIAMASGEAVGRREVILKLARDLRNSVATTDAAGPQGSAYRTLAWEVRGLSEGLDRDLADLRLFARMSLPECADLLRLDCGQLAPRWSSVKAILFAGATKKPRPEL